MSRWKEQFEKHAIHKTLQQVNDWLTTEIDDLGNGDIVELRRCKKVFALISKSVSNLDAETVPIDQLNSLNQQIRQSNIWNELNAFASNGNVSNLKNANDQMNTIMQFLTWLVPYSNISDEVVKINSLQDTVDEIINSLSNKKDVLSDELISLSAKVTVLVEEKDQLELAIEQRRQDVDQQVTQWQQQFSDAQDKRSSSYSVWKDKIETELKDKTAAIIKETTDDIEELSNTSNETLNKTLDSAQSKHQEIIDLFQLASGDSISGGYAQSAASESFQSNLWRGIAVAFICLTAFWIFSAYTSAIDRSNAYSNNGTQVPTSIKSEGIEVSSSPSGNITSSFDWSSFLLSISLTGVLLYGAAFSALQSNRHRENEKQMRWFALQIKALDPYINSLNDDDQKELKKKLSEKFFTAPSESLSKENMISDNAVSTMTKAMVEVIKASKGQ